MTLLANAHNIANTCLILINSNIAITNAKMFIYFIFNKINKMPLLLNKPHTVSKDMLICKNLKHANSILQTDLFPSCQFPLSSIQAPVGL